MLDAPNNTRVKATKRSPTLNYTSLWQIPFHCFTQTTTQIRTMNPLDNKSKLQPNFFHPFSPYLQIKIMQTHLCSIIQQFIQSHPLHSISSNKNSHHSNRNLSTKYHFRETIRPISQIHIHKKLTCQQSDTVPKQHPDAKQRKKVQQVQKNSIKNLQGLSTRKLSYLSAENLQRTALS